MQADELDRLKQIRIEDVVVASGLHLVRRGRNYTTEEHDSLVLFTKTNSWFHYQQGVGGDVLAWVQHVQRCDFQAACAYLLRAEPLAQLPARVPLAPVVPPPPLARELALRMHAARTSADAAWWFGKGLSEVAQEHFLLGVYQHRSYGTCYSIPVFEDGALVNIRLRLANPARPSDKYRPYDENRGTQLYNGDVLTPDVKGVVLVAGEIKACVLWQFGIPAVSPTAGCGHWRPDWTTRLAHCRLVYVAYDPGEEVAAARMATEIGDRARCVTLPMKPDDFVLTEGAPALRYHLKHAPPLAEWRKTLTVAVSTDIAAALYQGAQPVQPTSDARAPWQRQLWRKE